MNPLLPLLALVCQDPAAGAPPRVLDVVELRNGDRLTGRVTAELDGYVEVQLEQGATIGLSRTMVASIRRGAVEQPAVTSTIAPHDEWFVLHDASGASVGWLHAAVTVDAAGQCTVSEEYEFVDCLERYQVTNLCVAEPNGRAVSSYFRERISEPALAAQRLPAAAAGAEAERIVRERIVEATSHGDRLHVLRLDVGGRRERELPWSEGATFPLLARTLARHTADVVGPVPMFDSANESVVVRCFDGTRSRRMLVDGRLERVAEVAETTVGQHSEWIDAAHRTVRRELAGPGLVAVPSSRDSARLAVGVTSIPGAIVAEAEQRFGLWVPNPAWSAAPDLPAGHAGLDHTALAATVRLSRLDHLEPDAALDTAADAVANWLVLLHPGLTVELREPSVVRDRAAVHLEAQGRVAGGRLRAAVDVIPHGQQHLVLVCVSPAEAWDELAGDFGFVRRTLELDAAALAPPLQGPLAARERRTRQPGQVDGARAAPAVPAAPERAGRSGPVVRIPN